MSDSEDSSVLAMPAPGVDNPTSAVDPRILAADTFLILRQPTPFEIIQTMARVAKFINKYAGNALTSEVISAANPAMAGMFNASAQLEQGAVQLQQLLMQQQQQAQANSGLAVPQGPQAVRSPGGPGGRNNGGFPN